MVCYLAEKRWQRLMTKRLRIHATQEWHDLYQPSTNDELQLFFDRYTKAIDNGLEEKLPRVRVSLIGYNTVGQRQLQ